MILAVVMIVSVIPTFAINASADEFEPITILEEPIPITEEAVQGFSILSSSAISTAEQELAKITGLVARRNVGFVMLPRGVTEAAALIAVAEKAALAIDSENFTVTAVRNGGTAPDLTIGTRTWTTIRFTVTNKANAEDTATSSANVTIDISVGDTISNANFYLNVGDLGNIRDLRITNNYVDFTRYHDNNITRDASPNFVLPFNEGGRQADPNHQWMGELIFATRSAATIDGLAGQEFVEQDTNRTLAQGGSTTAANATLTGDMVNFVRRDTGEDYIRTRFIGGPVAGSGPAPSRARGTVLRGFDAISEFRTDTEDGTLLWEITVENKSDQFIEFGDIGLPLPWNNRYTSLGTTYTDRVTAHHFAGLDSGYAYAIRPSGEGNFVLLTPVPESGAKIEYVDQWHLNHSDSFDMPRDPNRSWGGDGPSFSGGGNAWQPGLSVHYIHSANIRNITGAARSPQFSTLVLAPGESHTYQFKFHAIRGGDGSPEVSPDTTGSKMQEKEDNFRSTLYNMGMIGAVAVPSFQPVLNMPTKLALQYDPDKISNVVLKIQCIHENDVYGEEFIPGRPLGNGDRDFVNNTRGYRGLCGVNNALGYARSISTPTAVKDHNGEWNFVYDMTFDCLGNTGVVVTYDLLVGESDGVKKFAPKSTQFEFNVMAELDVMVNTRSDFMVNVLQYHAPANPTLAQDCWDGVIRDTYFHTNSTDNRPLNSNTSTSQWWDDWAHDNIMFLTQKNILNPIEDEIRAIEKYLMDFLWNNKNPNTGLGYWIRRSSDVYNANGNGYPVTNVFNGLNGSDWSGSGGRQFTISMIWNSFFDQYLIQRAYPNLVQYRECRLEYLRIAYSIFINRLTSNQGHYGEQNIPLLIESLLEEGMFQEAQRVIDRISPSNTSTSGKGGVAVNTRYPYGSEFVYDNTGEEGIYANAQSLIRFRPDNILVRSGDAAKTLTMVDMATRAKRSWAPTWFHHANPVFIGGNSWWNFQYTASLAGSIMDDYLRYQSEIHEFDNEAKALAQRLNYGAKLANFNCINMGQISDRLIGATSWRYSSYKGAHGTKNVNDGNGGVAGTGNHRGRTMYNGWQSFSGEADLGLYGALLRISTDVVASDPVFGLYAYGGIVSESDGVYTVQPRDGFGKRLNFLDEKLYIELTHDRYTEANIWIDGSRLIFDVEHMQPGEHNSRFVFTGGMNPGVYTVTVDGVVQPAARFLITPEGTGHANVLLADKEIGASSVVLFVESSLTDVGAPTISTSINTLANDEIIRTRPFLIQGFVNYNAPASFDFLWSVESAPEGAVLTIDNNRLQSIRAVASQTGDYVVRLTATVRGSEPPITAYRDVAFTAAPIIVTVDRVTVTPGTATIPQTGIQAFSASVVGTNLDASELGYSVTWSLKGAGARGTSISQDGVLNIAANETATTLTVVATSDENPAVFSEVAVTVTIPVISGVTVNANQNAARGRSTALAATVAGENLTAATRLLVWTIVDADGKAEGTTLSPNGTLTVDAEETLTSLTVRATSRIDGSVYGEGVINITAPTTVNLQQVAVYGLAAGNIARLPAVQQLSDLAAYYNPATGAGITRPGINVNLHSNAGGHAGVLRIIDGTKNQAAGSAYNNWGTPNNTHGLDSNPVYVVINFGEAYTIDSTRVEFTSDGNGMTSGTQVARNVRFEWWDGTAWQPTTNVISQGNAGTRPVGTPIPDGNFVNIAATDEASVTARNRPNWNGASFDPVTTTMVRLRVVQWQTATNTNGVGISEWEIFGARAAQAEFAVTYNLNGAAGTPPATEFNFAGARFASTGVLAADVVPPAGGSFEGWNTAADDSGDFYPVGAMITMPGSNMTLFAIWEQSACLCDDIETVTVPATCTAQGTITKTCKACGEVDVENIPALGHNYVSVVTAPTCMASGFTTHTCSRCGDSYTDSNVPALGHVYVPANIEATCVTAGRIAERCTRCGDINVTQDIPALGHDLTTVTVPATCTAAGSATTTCSRCDHRVVVAIPILAHRPIVGEEVLPTPTEPGYRVMVCEICGIELQRIVLPALCQPGGGNANVSNARFLSISNSNGITTVTFTATVVLPDGSSQVRTYSFDVAANNSNINGRYVFPSSHELAGSVLTYDIKGNGSNIKAFSFGEAAISPGHRAVVGEERLPTATEPGLRVMVCANCGIELERVILPATGQTGQPGNVTSVSNARFLSASNSSRVTTVTFTATVVLSNGTSEVRTYSFDVGASNNNIDGRYVFPASHDLAGSTLTYDIKGNGSNVKAFSIR